MFQVNDTVSYSTTGVCRIVAIRKEHFSGQTANYYVLEPAFQRGATVYVPVDSPLADRMQTVLTADDVTQLIDELPREGTAWIDNDTLRAAKGREIMHSGDRARMMQLIHTIDCRQQALIAAGRHLRMQDAALLKEAQTLLGNEIAVALDIAPDEVSSYVHERLAARG